MEKVLSAWSLKSIQEAFNIQMHLANNGKSWADVKEYLEQVKKNRQRMLKPKRKLGEIISCPECGRQLNISIIDEHSDKYKEGFRTYLLCGASCCKGKGCGYEKFSELTVEELSSKNKEELQ